VQTYVTLLRGINVGGNRKVEMAKLRQSFESLGFEAVRTLIASGNVIFRASSIDAGKLARQIEAAIEKDFGFEVDVMVLNQDSIERLVKAIPASWVNDKDTKCDVMFLWPQADNPGVIQQLPPTKPEIEDVKYVPGAVLWRIDRVNAGRSRMFKISGTALYKQMTIRNPNTVRKIYELMKAAS
jgi:uncharacterized protein (DUF1697 family)